MFLKTKIISLIFFISICLCSCLDSALDVVPETVSTYTNFYKKAVNIESSVYQLAASVPIKYTFHDKIGQYRDYQVLQKDADDNGQEWGRINYDPFWVNYESIGESWQQYYSHIYECYALAENWHKCEDWSEEQKSFYQGVTYFFIAFDYFKITRAWGDAPLVKDNSDLMRKYARSSAGEVLDYALEYALKAAELLKPYEDLKKADGDNVGTKQIPGKGAAYTLLAFIYNWKAYLNNHDTEYYKLAEEYCSKVLKGDGGFYKLASNPEEVCESVFYRGHDEVIFENLHSLKDSRLQLHSFPFLIKDRLVYPVNPRVSIVNESSVVTYDMLNELYSKDDLRRTSYFYKPDDFEDYTWLHDGKAYMYKCRHVEIMNNLIQNTDCSEPEWRLAEIYLLRAECRCRLNDEGGAVADLNEIRHRAGLGDYNNEDGSDIRRAVFKERTRELLWEKGRYYAAIRNGFFDALPPVFSSLSQQDIKDGALYMPVYDAGSFGAFVDNDLMRQTPFWLDRI